MKQQTETPMNEALWQALKDKNREQMTSFFYAVQTTGIYCRPGCASPLPRRENVAFFNTLQEAEQQGFRPCKRCQPHLPENENQTLLVEQVCRLIEGEEALPTLDDLARSLHMSPSHLQRQFKRATGFTPKTYAARHRQIKLQQALPNQAASSTAIYAAGFGSVSRVYEKTDRLLGMTPAQYQKGGVGLSIQATVAPCYLGFILIAATQNGICSVTLGDSPEELWEGLTQRFLQAKIDKTETLSRWVEEILKHLEHPQHVLALPLDIQGNVFQIKVWQALQAIPAGHTRTYGEIASQIQHPGAAQAVGQACAANPLAVVIPCHRVLRKDCSLSGYRWGLERKQQLLKREAVSAATEFPSPSLHANKQDPE